MNFNNNSIALLSCITIGLVLSGCGTAPQRPGPPAEVIDKQIEVDEPTQVHAAPEEEYILPDSDAASALNNAAILIQQGQYGLAQEQIADLDPETMTPDMMTLKRSLDATLLLEAGGAAKAASLLGRPPEGTHPSTLQKYYRVLARTNLELGRTLSSIRNLATLDNMLATTLNNSEIIEVQRLLWGALGLTSTADLLRLSQGQDATLSGWARLALAARGNRGNAAGTDQAITQWLAQHPGHPASAELLDEIRLASTIQNTGMSRVALLLPISSRYAQAAGAIRDGLTAMNNDLPASRRSMIRIYDYGKDENLVALYYRQAVNDGADIVIGPLGRAATGKLLSEAEISSPTILLSPAENGSVNSDMLYTFALSPEQEARQAAQRSWLDGRHSAVIMYPNDKLGQRMARAYRDRYTTLGGKIIGEASYDPAGNEGYSATISRLLGVDQSEARINDLSRRLGLKLKHEARRRQDIEAIFLPAPTDDARLIKPEFDFYYALDLPVYSTSRVFSGKLDKINDADLNRVRFPDMPWLIGSNVEIDSLRTFMQVDPTQEGSRYDRLYALGMDLHVLTEKLDKLSISPELYLQGLSGNLHIEDDGTIEYDMIWAVFRDGSPALLDRNSGYQGRYDDRKFTPAPRRAPAER